VGVSGDDQLTTAESSALIEWLGRAEIVRSVDISPTNGHVLSQRVSDKIVLTFPKCDIDGAVRKLEQDILRLRAEVERARAKLANESFVSRAPAQLVADEKEKLQKYEAQLNEAILRRDALGV
jgi:valyl-tRNA synthetase